MYYRCARHDFDAETIYRAAQPYHFLIQKNVEQDFYVIYQDLVGAILCYALDWCQVDVAKKGFVTSTKK